MAVISATFGGALAKALGLPKNTVWFELRCAVREPVTVKCGYYPDELKSGEIVELFSEYELRPKE